jgi:type III secretion protein V
VHDVSLSLTAFVSSDLWQRAQKHGHFFAALGLAGVVALMVLPIPPALLDLLLAINMASGVLLLMMALYIRGPLGLTTFPSLLLITTVFRLALNVASTKQILLHAHAGEIIETFGRLVMGGQVVVGLVVFVIIAIVQFIVVAKGAERVAEVGARFTLDAMPGKQMSIDADLRAGAIDKNTAFQRRSVLEQECQMHGAMDGAMKFVKGDSIAAIIIAVVNIVAGIAIGTVQRGMSLSDSAARYVLLSVGDGMVSQIPSLFASVSAGILITRVSGQALSGDGHLAGQIGRQLMAQPLALIASAIILMSFVLVPGFPKLPFFVLACLAAGVGFWIRRRDQQGKGLEALGAVGRQEAGHGGAVVPAPAEGQAIVSPLRIRLSLAMRERLMPPLLDAALAGEKTQLQQALGLPFPALSVQFDAALPDDDFVIDVQEIPARRGQLPDTLPSGEREALMAKTVAEVVRYRPDAFVGLQEIHGLIGRAESQLPELSAEVLRALPLQRLAEVLKRLAMEGVSLRYLREIYESLLLWALREKDTAMLCEHVRVELGRFICHPLVDENRRLRVLTLDPATEQQVRQSIQQGPSGAYLTLPPQAVGRLITAVEAAVKRWPGQGLPVLLTTIETRRFVRKLVANKLPMLSVLSHQELPADIMVESVGRIGALATPAIEGS